MNDKLKAKYEATIFEHEDGSTKIFYKCDKELNKECEGYKNCRECNHTDNINYAKNYLIKTRKSLSC